MAEPRLQPVPRLPAAWLEEVRSGTPSLAADLVRLIRTQVPEYVDDPDGQIAREINRAVQAAARSLVGVLAGRSGITDVPVEVFRRLGRLEAMAGRSHNALQAAYRLAGLRIIQRLAEWEEQFDVSRDLRAHVADLVTRFMDHLANLSIAGYEESAGGARSAEARRRFVDLLLSGRRLSRHELRTWTARVGWTPPDAVRVLEFDPAEALGDRQVELLAAVLGPAGLVGRIGDRLVAVVEPERAVDEIALRLPLGVTLFVGPAVPLGDVAVSGRLASRAARHLAGQLGAVAPIVDCSEVLLSLLGRAAEDVFGILARERLAPLSGLSLRKRVEAGRLLAGWLEFGAVRAGGPGAVGVSRSTLRYRKARLEETFGAALEDRNRRVELILALRWQLPRWEAELEMVKRRRANRPKRQVDRSAQAGSAEVDPLAQVSEGNS